MTEVVDELAAGYLPAGDFVFADESGDHLVLGSIVHVRGSGAPEPDLTGMPGLEGIVDVRQAILVVELAARAFPCRLPDFRTGEQALGSFLGVGREVGLVE